MRTARDWRPELHPRDPFGKFTDDGADPDWMALADPAVLDRFLHMQKRRERRARAYAALTTLDSGGKARTTTTPLGGGAAGQAAHDAVPAGLYKPGTLTREQHDALAVYETGWCMVINGVLRGDKLAEASDEDRATIGHLDDAMDASRLTEPIEAHRGLFNASSLFGDRIELNLEGFSWQEKAYSSTTTDEAITDQFLVKNAATGGLDEFGDNVRMVVRVAAGLGALQTSTATEGSDTNGPQAEITLQRNTRWTVVTDRGYDADGVRVLEVAVDRGD